MIERQHGRPKFHAIARGNISNPASHIWTRDLKMLNDFRPKRRLFLVGIWSRDLVSLETCQTKVSDLIAGHPANMQHLEPIRTGFSSWYAHPHQGKLTGKFNYVPCLTLREAPVIDYEDNIGLLNRLSILLSCIAHNERNTFLHQQLHDIVEVETSIRIHVVW